jgi:hypothetical protein
MPLPGVIETALPPDDEAMRPFHNRSSVKAGRNRASQGAFLLPAVSATLTQFDEASPRMAGAVFVPHRWRFASGNLLTIKIINKPFLKKRS